MGLSIYIVLIIICILILILLIYFSNMVRGRAEDWEVKILDYSFNGVDKDNKPWNYTNINLVVSDKDFIKVISILVNGEKINLKSNCIFKYNRYYFSLLDFDKTLGNVTKVQNDKLQIDIENKNLIVDFKGNLYKILKEDYFRVPAILFNNTWYVSLIDMVRMFDLKVVYNYHNNEIKLYNSRNEMLQEERKRLNRPALIRLEDISAGGDYSNQESLQKLRIITDLLSHKNIPYHIAWVPRYKDPTKGIDNDLLNNFSMFNADFLFTLDYMIAKGGIAGLHGYTHQHENGISVEDSEFGINGDPSVEAAETRALAAIRTAKELNIPYKFFESPHYSSTEEQQAVFEKYFDYIFEPCQGIWNDKPIISPRNNKTIYVPAPIGYVHGNNIRSMLRRIKNNPNSSLGGLFYHPFKEFDAITLIETEDGYPEYSYSSASMLNNILDCLEKEKYTLVKITDIVL